jgi:hypothetical protein
MSASTQYPLPYDKAVVSFLSSSLDLANATVSVTVNSKQIYAGAVRSVTVPLGAGGSVSTVVATLSAQGTEYTQTLRLQPEDVVLIPEPLAAAPASYPGKPRIPLEGNVRVVAVANMKTAKGAVYSPSALAYSWTVDGTRLANSSGIGKNTIIVSSPLEYRAREVSVVVTSADGSVTGGASLSLTAEQPTLRIYENDPLLGIRFERALVGSFTITGTETSLFAAPFSLPIVGGAPVIAWFLDGASAQSGNSITLRPAGNGEGRASVSVVASSGQFLKAAANLLLSFGATPSSNFFGL